MSDVAREQIDLRAVLARIDRDLAESDKLRAEQRKLTAEAQKLALDRWLAPALAIAAVFGGLLGVATFIAHLIGH